MSNSRYDKARKVWQRLNASKALEMVPLWGYWVLAVLIAAASIRLAHNLQEADWTLMLGMGIVIGFIIGCIFMAAFGVNSTCHDDNDRKGR